MAQEFARLGKKERGLIGALVEKITGLSTSQVTRLIRKYLDSGQVRPEVYTRNGFAVRYTGADIALLADVERAHGAFGQTEYARLAEISVAHLYNLRNGKEYRRQAAAFDATRPTAVSIGERRKPAPQGRPGFLRVDTVHQGDWDGAKGVYHINAVDTVTQWEVIGCVSRISEAFLMPVLEAILHQFPFPLLRFHSDNGSEFINRTVARLLEKLHAEFTKSRAGKCQDNALVEGKNGAVIRNLIRNLIGYGHIPGEHTEALQKFYTAQLNPYLNFHRPCGFATVSVDERGKRVRTYKTEDYKTPYEKLKSLPDVVDLLKPGVNFTYLDQVAGKMTDTECARKMTSAKTTLLRQCKIESPVPPQFA